MQVKIDAIDNGYTLTYWAGERYRTEFAGDWTATAEKAKSLLAEREPEPSEKGKKGTK